MRLLFDHNLSPRLVRRVADLYPEAVHVADVGLERADDREVWSYARVNGLTIVTKDSDFNDLSVFRGFPPKVLWLQLGNCTTRDIESALRSNEAAIRAFAEDPEVGVLAVV